MSVGNIDTFGLSDISIKDLVLDDLAGYAALLDEIDVNIIDRQASIVMYEVYRSEENFPVQTEIPIVVKRWVATHTALRLIPSLRTWIAKYEKRGDTTQEGAISNYDQLAMLDDVEATLKFRVHDLRNEVQVVLNTDYTPSGPQYDRPGVSDSSNAPAGRFATLDPWRIGQELYRGEEDYTWRRN